MDTQSVAELNAPRRIEAGNATFTYLEQGGGTPLVLLHGIGSGARSWKLQLASLAGQFRVVAWDAPGYGDSSALPMEHPDASDYSAALARFLDAVGVDRLHLVGHSLGTVMALRFAAEHPQRVRSLTLASLSSGHSHLPETERAALRDGRLGDLAALGPQGMAQKRGPRLLSPRASDEQKRTVIETMSMLRPAGFTQAVWMLSGANTRVDLASLPRVMPVQIVYGDADVVTSPASIAEVAAVRPDVPLRVVTSAGHALYLEQPAAFDAALCRFIGNDDA